MSRSSYLRLLGAVFVAALVAVLVGASPATRPQAPLPQDSERPILNWQDSNPHAVLTEAFEVVGFDRQDASDAATAVMVTMGLRQEHLKDGKPPLDWKNSNLHALLYTAFVARGYEHRPASELASKAVAAMTGRALEGTECWAYLTEMIYCENGQKKKVKLYTNGLCVENVLDVWDCGPVPECTGGDVLWLEMGLSGECELPPPSESCVYVRWHENGQWVPCEDLDIDCDCFDETTQADCDRIGFHCADNLGGPAGCPDCE